MFLVVEKELELDISEVSFWTDCTTVLKYIKKDSLPTKLLLYDLVLFQNSGDMFLLLVIPLI